MATLGTGLSYRWVKPLEDDDAEFHLRPLDGVEYLDLLDSMTTAEFIPGGAAFAALQRCCNKWRGVFDDAGSEVDFNPQLLRFLSAEMLNNLSKQMMDISDFKEEDAKNSSSQ